MSMRGRARSAGAQITQIRNHGRAMPARPTSLGEVNPMIATGAVPNLGCAPSEGSAAALAASVGVVQ